MARILYVITKANWGGAQKYVYDLALAAKDAGHEVKVAYGESGTLSARLADAHIPIVAIPAMGRNVHLGNDSHLFFSLRALFERERPDVVHLNSAKAAGLGALTARIAGVPRIIFTAHGWAFNESRPWWQRVLIWNLSGITVLLAHTTICVSDAVKRQISSFPFATRKCVVIKNGVTCPALLPREEAREALLPNHARTYWIGMISELHTTKRISDAIDAFARLKDEFPDAILVVIGEGEERKRLQKLIHEKNLTGRVFILGFVPQAPAKLSAFDLFLHTSRSEALAYAILEAGCAALPTIATAVGGIPEIIEDGVSGILVPPLRPDLVAEKMRGLMQDTTRAHQLGTNLHSRVVTEFSESKMAAYTLALYL